MGNEGGEREDVRNARTHYATCCTVDVELECGQGAVSAGAQRVAMVHRDVPSGQRSLGRADVSHRQQHRRQHPRQALLVIGIARRDHRQLHLVLGPCRTIAAVAVLPRAAGRQRCRCRCRCRCRRRADVRAMPRAQTQQDQRQSRQSVTRAPPLSRPRRHRRRALGARCTPFCLPPKLYLSNYRISRIAVDAAGGNESLAAARRTADHRVFVLLRVSFRTPRSSRYTLHGGVTPAFNYRCA